MTALTYSSLVPFCAEATLTLIYPSLFSLLYGNHDKGFALAAHSPSIARIPGQCYFLLLFHIFFRKQIQGRPNLAILLGISASHLLATQCKNPTPALALVPLCGLCLRSANLSTKRPRLIRSLCLAGSQSSIIKDKKQFSRHLRSLYISLLDNAARFQLCDFTFHHLHFPSVDFASFQAIGYRPNFYPLHLPSLETPSGLPVEPSFYPSLVLLPRPDSVIKHEVFCPSRPCLCYCSKRKTPNLSPSG